MSDLNLAEKICLQVSEDIRSGIYKPGQQLPAERELVQTYKASRVTINRALAMLDARGMLHRRQGVGTFVSQELPAHDRRDGELDSSMFVKYISSGGIKKGDLYVAGGQEEMHRELDRDGRHLVISFYRSEEEYSRELEKFSVGDMFGALIWHRPSQFGDRMLQHMMARGLRFVLMDSYIRDFNCDYVVTDNYEGSVQMVDYLVSLGHRDIVYITEDLRGFTSLEDRRTGFISGMMNRQCEIANDSILYAQIGNRPTVERVVDSILSRQRRPTALFASNDMLAFDLYDVLKNRGLRVPEDISLVGYDDVDRSAHFDIPLTTVAQDFRQMARVAVALLNKQPGRAGARDFFHQVKIKPTLVQRLSAASISR